MSSKTEMKFVGEIHSPVVLYLLVQIRRSVQYLSFGRTEGGRQSVTLSVGRPFAERD